jgi:hypothetical protein
MGAAANNKTQLLAVAAPVGNLTLMLPQTSWDGLDSRSAARPSQRIQTNVRPESLAVPAGHFSDRRSKQQLK